LGLLRTDQFHYIKQSRHGTPWRQFFVRANDLSGFERDQCSNHSDGFHFSRVCALHLLGFSDTDVVGFSMDKRISLDNGILWTGFHGMIGRWFLGFGFNLDFQRFGFWCFSRTLGLKDFKDVWIYGF
jgi:hypothetical protein